jgi:glycosyltransferase involved in cell wall biosynthesis
MSKISVVIPAFNEEASIDSVIGEIKDTLMENGYDFEIIVVDDASQDSTAKKARNMNVKLLQHPYNKGYGASLKTGIRQAQGEIIVISDADGTYPVRDIPTLLHYMDSFDMVVGARIGRNVKMPWVRRPAKFILSRLAALLVSMKVPDLNSGLRAFKKDIVLDLLPSLPSGFSFTTTLTLAMLSDEYDVKFVPIDYYERKGRSKIRPIEDTYNFALLIIRMIMYYNPLRIFLPIASLLFLVAMAVVLYDIIVFHLVTKSALLLTFVAIQVGVTGLLADQNVVRHRRR